MFLCLISLKLCLLEEAVVPEPRKQKLNVEILHILKEL